MPAAPNPSTVLARTLSDELRRGSAHVLRNGVAIRALTAEVLTAQADELDAQADELAALKRLVLALAVLHKTELGELGISVAVTED